MATRWSILTLSQWQVERGCDWALLVLMTELSFPPSHSPWEGGGMLSFTLLGEVLGLFPPFLRAWEDLHWAVPQVHSALTSLLCSVTARQVAGGGLWDLCSAGTTPVWVWRGQASLRTAGGRRRPVVLQTRASSGSIQRRTCLQAKEAPGKWGTLVQCYGWWAAMAQA